MQLHQIKPNTTRKSAKRVGRGGKRGKTSGRGHKGQLARAGNSTRPEMRDIIKKIPKLRGHGVNRSRTVHGERDLPEVVNLAAIESAYKNGETVSPKTLVAKSILSKTKARFPKVKILGNGDLTKKVTISNCTFSASVKEKVEKAGGTIA